MDALRFGAALMVVAFHWLFNGIDNGKVQSIEPNALAPIAIYGVYGVHLFFLISGFVIAESVRGKTAGQFVVSRGVRLFPAYWVAMVLTTVVVNTFASDAMRVSPVQFLANLTMAPVLFRQSPVDGVYWTLTLELTFYAFVLIAMIFGLMRQLDVIFPGWACLMLVMTIAAPQLSLLPFLGGYYSLFAGGAILSTIRRRGVSPWSLLGLFAALASSLIFVLRDVENFNQTHSMPLSAPIVGGILVLFFVLMSLLCIPGVDRVRLPLSRPISDLTYPVYLIHAHIGYTVLERVATDENKTWIYVVMFVGLLVAAWLLHWGVESALKAFWWRFFGVLRAPVDRLQRRIARSRKLSIDAMEIPERSRL